MPGPNFIVIGSAKCATTSLCSILGRHPQIFMSEPKEPNFFAQDELYERGVDWYEDLFAGGGDAVLRGEGSARYTVREVYPRAAARIAAYDPTMKLVYSVRHPLRRIEAAYLEILSWGERFETRVERPFAKALRRNSSWLVASTNYRRELEAYRQHFPDEQILVMFFEDFVTDSDSAVRRCLEFLGADPKVELAREGRHENPSVGKKVPSRALAMWRGIRPLRRIGRLLPESTRAWIGDTFLLREVRERPSWDPKTLAWVRDQLEADSREFLERYGKPADFWSFDEPRG